jgi:hypothetical protein
MADRILIATLYVLGYLVTLLLVTSEDRRPFTRDLPSRRAMVASLAWPAIVLWAFLDMTIRDSIAWVRRRNASVR